MKIPVNGIRIELARLMGIEIKNWDHVPPSIEDLYCELVLAFREYNGGKDSYEKFLAWINSHEEQELKSIITLITLGK
jgi:hypothetical protein